MTDLTLVTLHHTPTLTHTHIHQINPLHTLATAGGEHVDSTYTDSNTHTQTHSCSVTDGRVTPTTVVHFHVRGEQRLSEVIWGKRRQNTVLSVEEKLLIAA